MKTFFKGKAVGFYLLLAALILGIASTVYYVLWGNANYALNQVVAIALGVGVAVNVLLLFIHSDYLKIALTALYGAGMIQLAVDNAGSFADAYQGIVMFGDPTQVGTLIQMIAMLGVAVLCVIVASFMGTKKAE